MSAIKVIVFIPSADDRWLKPVSLQIETLQFFIIGRVSEIVNSSSEIHLSLNSEFIILFKIICSWSFFPVAKKNLQFLTIVIFFITDKKVSAGIRFVGPDPPIPRRILTSFLLILYFEITEVSKFLSISIWGSLLVERFNLFLTRLKACLVICCFFLLNKGYW